MAYTNTNTITASAVVTATEARVRELLKHVRVELGAACYRGLVEASEIEKWLADLSYMLQKNALINFQVRVHVGGELRRAWCYDVSDDGRVLGSGENGGGIDFYQFPAGSHVSLVISRRQGLSRAVSEEIDRRGWTRPVESLQGSGVRERVYEKDGYGLIRHRFDYP